MHISRVLSATVGGYLEGHGGRKFNNTTRMQGSTLTTLKHHYALTPLFVIMGAGVTMVLSMIVRAARKQTDVNWVKSKETDYTVNHYRAKQYQFINPSGKDLTKPSPVPDYRN